MSASVSIFLFLSSLLWSIQTIHADCRKGKCVDSRLFWVYTEYQYTVTTRLQRFVLYKKLIFLRRWNIIGELDGTASREQQLQM